MSLEEVLKENTVAIRELIAALGNAGPVVSKAKNEHDAKPEERPAATSRTAGGSAAQHEKEKPSEKPQESAEEIIYGTGKEGENSLSRKFLDAIKEPDADGNRLGADGVVSLLKQAGLIEAKFNELKEQPEKWTTAQDVLLGILKRGA